MGHYLDIRLRPGPELDAAHLMTALYTRLHRALVQLQSDSIGVSFPEYDGRRPTLGTRLRLFGPQAALEQMTALPWLSGIRDHVTVTDILPIPAHARYRTLRRVQVKSSPERLRRRLMKRHQLTEAQAAERIPDAKARQSDQPFVVLTSASTGQRFRLFLELGAEEAQSSPGSLNTYGLSATATVPWF